MWTDSKAALLAEAIQGFGAKATALADDVIDLVAAPGRGRKAWPPKTWCVVNTTASLNVREALAAAGERLQVRVLECSLFAHGRVGLLTVEGPERSPDTGDLITAAYRLIMEDPELGRLVFGKAAEARRERVGESCGSLTMIMSDARVSVFSACMSEATVEMQRISLPSAGSVLIALMSEDGCNLVWRRHEVPPSVRIGGAGLEGWRVHVAAAAAQKIDGDIARWPGVESGGVLMGRLSEAAKTFYIEDVLPAPEDSVRTAHGFTLGRQGLSPANHGSRGGGQLVPLLSWDLARPPRAERSFRAGPGDCGGDRALAAHAVSALDSYPARRRTRLGDEPSAKR